MYTESMNTQETSAHTEIEDKLDANTKKLEEIYASVEKTRKYFLIILVINVLVFVVPLILAIFVVPAFLESYLGQLGSLGF